MKLFVDKQAVPEVVEIDATTVTVRWSPVEVSVQTTDEEDVADSNFVISYLLQMQHVTAPDSKDDGGEVQRAEEEAGGVIQDADLLSRVSEEAWCMQYWGAATHVQVKGLRPGRYYAMCVQCNPSVINGSADVELLPPSRTLVFRSKSAVPSAMLPPVLLERNKTSLKLHLAEPDDQGRHPVTEYVVEGTVPTEMMDDFGSNANAHGMWEIYRGPKCTFVWDNLAPGMRYSARARAVNYIGEGAFSSSTSFLTQPSAPDAPSGILCLPTSPDTIVLRWDRPKANGADILSYTVELNDRGSQFRAIARIQVCSLVLDKLTTGQTYKIRVSAENSEGRSDWSPVAVYEVDGNGGMAGVHSGGHGSSDSLGLTMESGDSSLRSLSEDRPGTPTNLRHHRMKNSSVFSWEPRGPSLADQKFILEIAEVDENKNAAHIWKVRYKSDEPRHEIHTLKSDLRYQVAVKSTSSLGDSSYCESIMIEMKELTGKVPVPIAPRNFAYVDWPGPARLSWHLDPKDAVDCIFELYVANTEDLGHKKKYIRKNAFNLLYRGDDMSHTFGEELTVGNHYTARVRSMRGGKTSEWSGDVGFEYKVVEKWTKITQVRAEKVAPTSTLLSWAHASDVGQPTANAAKESISYAISLEEVRDEFEDPGHPGCASCTAGNSALRIIHTKTRDGQATVGDLRPDFLYRVRVREQRGSSHGPWSEPITIETQPALLAPEMYVESKSKDAICLAWQLPANRKGRELATSVEIQETKLAHFAKASPRLFNLDACTSFIASGLTVGSLYGFRIRLHSSDVAGPWSRMLQVETEPGPPSKPQEPAPTPTGVSNAFKVSWRHPHDNGRPITNFELSLARATSPTGDLDPSNQTGVQYLIVYQGPDLMARVQNLDFGTKYNVRVRAHNSCGHGPWSDPAAIETLEKPPEPPENISAEMKGDQVAITWEPARYASTLHTGYEVEVKGHGNHKYRSERKPSIVVARKTCNASMASCAIPQPTPPGEISIRIRSIGSRGSGHGPWSSPCIIDTSPQRTTPPASPKHAGLLSKRSSDNEVAEPTSPNSSNSKKFKRRAFQKTATAKLPKTRFSLSNLFNRLRRVSRFDVFVLFFLCMMLMALYQTTMDVGFFGKPMRTYRCVVLFAPSPRTDTSRPVPARLCDCIGLCDDGPVTSVLCPLSSPPLCHRRCHADCQFRSSSRRS